MHPAVPWATPDQAGPGLKQLHVGDDAGPNAMAREFRFCILA